MKRTSRPTRARSGFTLIELVTVVVVIGVLSAAAAPAFRMLSASREGAAAGEIRRLLQVARSTAMASGRPTGLACTASSAVTPMQIESPGTAPIELLTPLGERAQGVWLPGLYPGIEIANAQLGSGESGSVTFWFADDGTPESRTPNGHALAAWTSDGSITLSGGTVITVRRVSGVIE